MTGSDLDLALSMGYFRMQQQVFTCHYLSFNDQLYTAHWLRIVLENVVIGKRQRDLANRNRAFTITAKPLVISTELDELYAVYRQSISFDAPVSVRDCLFGAETGNRFNTRVIEVRDEGRLIAAGIFDLGQNSLAGIMNFYHPDYRRHSLGKYLMWLKIRYGIQLRLTHYYPGYVVNHYPKFDYKVEAAETATEFFDASRDEWVPFCWETLRRVAAEMFPVPAPN